MARALTTNPQIDAYLRKVLQDANHHASTVTNVIMPLSQAVRARIVGLGAPGGDTVEVFERNGNLARVCWVNISGRRYCFSYNHSSLMIELRRRTTQGVLVFQFNYQTSQAAILQQAAQL